MPARSLLSLEKAGKSDIENQLAALRATLSATQSERDKLKAAADASGANAASAQGQVTQLSTALEGEKKISAGALAQVEALNQQISALRRQLAAIEQALDASEQKNKESQSRITELGQRLNVALAQKVQELTKYRSDFFGKLREILGNRPDVRIVGDRFVLQSELFFDSNKADLKPAATAELDKVASALTGLEQQIPKDIPWVLRVDGHTDVRPITGGQFKSNWDLSAARAARHLRQELKGTFGSAEIGEAQCKIRSDHSHQRHAVDVMPFGHHLRAHEDVDLARVELVEYALTIMSPPNRIAVEPTDARRGKRLMQPLLYLL